MPMGVEPMFHSQLSFGIRSERRICSGTKQSPSSRLSLSLNLNASYCYSIIKRIYTGLFIKKEAIMTRAKIFTPAILSLTVLVLVVACAPVAKLPTVDRELAEKEAHIQREMALLQQNRDMEKVFNISYTILKNGTELCPENIGNGTGITIANRYYFGEEFAAAAESALGLTDKVSITSVVPGSAADVAGVKDGDIIRSINGWRVPKGPEAIAMTVNKYRELQETKDEIILRLLRDGVRESATIKFDQICDYKYRVENSDAVNAFADGEGIHITTGMLRFVETDEELALIIGHEFAHNQMDHIDKKKGNAAVGLIFDLLLAGAGINTSGAISDAAAQAYSQEFEAEADYVGLYFAAHAGYDISQAPFFWRRMAIAHPGSIRSNHASSHPATPERFVALEAGVKEILAKQKNGEPLLPEMGFVDSSN